MEFHRQNTNKDLANYCLSADMYSPPISSFGFLPLTFRVPLIPDTTKSPFPF